MRECKLPIHTISVASVRSVYNLIKDKIDIDYQVLWDMIVSNGEDDGLIKIYLSEALPEDGDEEMRAWAKTYNQILTILRQNTPSEVLAIYIDLDNCIGW